MSTFTFKMDAFLPRFWVIKLPRSIAFETKVVHVVVLIEEVIGLAGVKNVISECHCRTVLIVTYKITIKGRQWRIDARGPYT